MRTRAASNNHQAMPTVGVSLCQPLTEFVPLMVAALAAAVVRTEGLAVIMSVTAVAGANGRLYNTGSLVRSHG